MCVRVDNFYRIREQIRKCINHRAAGQDFFCAVCFEPNCTQHHEGEDGYEDVLSQLGWWADVARWEAVKEVSALDFLGLLVPTWPLPQVLPVTEQAPGVDYVYKTALDMDIYGVINNGDRSVVVNEEGVEVDSVTIDIDQDGITWGYVTSAGFYPLATFSGGWAVEDYGPYTGEEKPIGYWVLPKVPSHCQFSRLLKLVGEDYERRK